ncbi:MAG: MobC family plasmid mobilization relaxosome protein [Chitinispirillales bacterium]|jgi:hypothetical protein|nr:MobC family plasmid mobilization relaxosome protein [Chitinispirillales bacterium]
MAKEKTTGFYFKMSPEEWELVEKRMAQTGIKNKSAFIRKMCIDGHVFNLDLTTLNEVKRLLGVTANNVNQIARRVNSGGGAYREDIAEVNDQLTEIRAGFGKLLALLSDVASAKPGKRFIPPPKFSDLSGYPSESVTTEEAV